MEDKELKFLSVMKDGIPCELELNKIFDKKIYNEIKVITFVASSSFLSYLLKGFSTIELILGIEDDRVKSEFNINIVKYFDVLEVNKFYNSLDEELKVKLNLRDLNIFYSYKYVVHDKIYILNNSQTNKNRVIIGSANLSKAAFSNKHQFETIEIFDNDTIRFDYYNKRFEDIKSKCVDYMPEKLKEKVKEASSDEIEKVPLISSEENFELLKEQLEKISNAEEIKFHISEELLRDIEDKKNEITYVKEDVIREEELLKLLIKKSPKYGYVFKTENELNKIRVKIKSFISKKRTSLDSDDRVFYKYDSNINKLFVQESIIDKEKSDNPILNIYSKKINKDDLKNQMELLVRIVESYKIFATSTSPDNRHKIYDTILYTFMSPFIWKAREQYVIAKGTETERRYIYPFLIIGGDYESGKSTILDICGRLVGNNTPFFSTYDKLSKTGYLKYLFETDNICPLFIDEIPQSFFTSKNKYLGEGLIKSVANDLGGQHPCFIGTTNVRDFYVSGQILSRIIYFEINTSFEKSKRYEAKEYLQKLREEIDDSLFRDFSYRIIEKIKSNEDIYSTPDILNAAREIFIDYFEAVEIEIPEWVYYTDIKDYESRGIEVWQRWYENNKSKFHITNNNTIFVNTLELWGIKDRNVDKYINLLNKDAFKEYSAPMLLLNKNEFLNFINESKNNSLFSFIREKIFKSS